VRVVGKGRVKEAPGGKHAKLNGGKAGDASTSAKPTSKFIILRCMHPVGLSLASGVDSNEEEVDSGVCACRRADRGGVRGAMERAANWLVGRL
jgi:hypothetical protein